MGGHEAVELVHQVVNCLTCLLCPIGCGWAVLLFAVAMEYVDGLEWGEEDL